MGRTQVARNRSQGRPGAKGRGRGKISTTTTTNNISRRVVNNDAETNKLGSNAWRYERKEIDLDTDLDRGEKDLSTYDDDGTIQGRGVYKGPSHDVVGLHSMDLDCRSESAINNDNQNLSTRIDASLLSISLNNLPMAEWMRMPQRHADFIDQRKVKNRDGKNTTNMPHISLRGEDVNDIDTNHGPGEKLNQINKDTKSQDYEVDTKDGNDKSVNKTTNVSLHETDLSPIDEGRRRSEENIQVMDVGIMEDSEEDLDSWLDSVIS